MKATRKSSETTNPTTNKGTRILLHIKYITDMNKRACANEKRSRIGRKTYEKRRRHGQNKHRKHIKTISNRELSTQLDTRIATIYLQFSQKLFICINNQIQIILSLLRALPLHFPLHTNIVSGNIFFLRTADYKNRCCNLTGRLNTIPHQTTSVH